MASDMDLFCTDCGMPCLPALVVGEVVLCPCCASDERVAALLQPA